MHQPGAVSLRQVLQHHLGDAFAVGDEWQLVRDHPLDATAHPIIALVLGASLRLKLRRMGRLKAVIVIAGETRRALTPHRRDLGRRLGHTSA